MFFNRCWPFSFSSVYHCSCWLDLWFHFSGMFSPVHCFYCLSKLIILLVQCSLDIFFLKINYLFIYFWLCWVFVAVRGLSLVAVSGGYYSLWCAGFSLQWLLLLRSSSCRHAGFSRCGSWTLEHRLSNCGAWAYLLRGMRDLPRPGIEPVSPALAGRFLTTEPPGKSFP